MSHCCKNNVVAADPICGGNTMAGLIIFILIILQFGKPCKEGSHSQLFDNSVLFILVLYCVACCGKVKLGC
jgi:hypothetical protein